MKGLQRGCLYPWYTMGSLSVCSGRGCIHSPSSRATLVVLSLQWAWEWKST